MRKVNEITYDLIKVEFADWLKGSEDRKGEKMNILISSDYWRTAEPSFKGNPMQFKSFRIR